MSSDSNKIASGFKDRTLVTAKLGMKLGFKAVKTALNKGDDDYTDNTAAMDVATQLLNDIDGLKGVVMKFGQMASYLGTSFPPEAQRVLAKLQAEASAMPFEQIKPVIESELGRSIDEVFEQFDTTACAAASIGQVHKAIYQGQAVAVKVQYPGVEEAIRSDLKHIGGLLLVGLTGAMQDGKGLTDELKNRILEECDYRIEAENQRYFKEAFKDHPDILIPDVFSDLSTKRLLITEFIDAMDFHDFKKSADQDSKNKAARTIFTFCIRSIFKHGVFNADPHPGNYLFTEDGRVAFLDFGCVKRFSPEMITSWRGMAKAILDDDLEQLQRYGTELGLVKRAKSFNWPAHLELMSHIYQPYKTEGEFTYNHAYVRETYEWYFARNKNRFSAKMPSDLLFVNRLSFGMDSILADLNATSEWAALFKHCVFD